MSHPIAAGTAIVLASAQANPLQLVLDGSGNVYWTDYGTSANSFTDGTISMMAVTGGTVGIVASSQQAPYGIVVGDTGTSLLLIWTNNLDGTVVAAAAAAAAPTTVLARNQTSPEGITIGTEGVYWTDTGSGTIETDPYFGADPTILATGQASPSTIVADASGNLWWANSGTAANNYTDGSIVKSAP